ncbi:hypothetical protein, partial [uncultured Sphingomonas sp.]|uniref:hypothetical protein n=1 Tax=uncultured Sphingomonas sp. TaxID=158754 RepID=UPI0035CA0910
SFGGVPSTGMNIHERPKSGARTTFANGGLRVSPPTSRPLIKSLELSRVPGRSRFELETRYHGAQALLDEAACGKPLIPSSASSIEDDGIQLHSR